jgi:hypothetical protein
MAMIGTFSRDDGSSAQGSLYDRVSISCAGPGHGAQAVGVSPPPPPTAEEMVPPPPVTAEVAVMPAPPPKVLDATEALRAFFAANLPPGGAIVEGDGPIGLEHTMRAGESAQQVAKAYIDLTTAYTESELANAILRTQPKLKDGKSHEGLVVRIPDVVLTAPKPPAEARLGWPEDKSLRAIYMNAEMMSGRWGGGFKENLAKMNARGINAIVVDAKDVTGWFTYPSKIPLALETNANKHAVIGSLARLVRVAHAQGIRVIARVSCFRDEHLGPTRGDLAIKNKGNDLPHKAPSKIVDWLDPTNETVQQYLVDVVGESLEAGVDEIQLDYVRYPTEGIWDADFHLEEKNLSTADVITGFVHRVHEKTKAAGVPLSLDVFGCVAWQYAKDMESTGQDLRRLGKEIEALSPMVYPSHFGVGFQGYEVPGDHPDIVAIGTKKAIETMHEAGVDNVVVRSWVQAFPWKSPHFGSGYIAEQIKEAKNGGGVGWLAWNSGGEYGATYAAVPLLKK